MDFQDFLDFFPTPADIKTLKPAMLTTQQRHDIDQLVNYQEQMEDLFKQHQGLQEAMSNLVN